MADLVMIHKNDSTILINKEDEDLRNYVWTIATNGYAVRGTMTNGERKSHLMHRVILERKIGRSLQSHEQVDHINRNRTDNRRENLRLATPLINSLNRSRQSNNTSGYMGVSYSKRAGRRKRWEAHIKLNRKRRFLGIFMTPEEAARAYDKAALELHGEFATLNFPNEAQL